MPAAWPPADARWALALKLPVAQLWPDLESPLRGCHTRSSGPVSSNRHPRVASLTRWRSPIAKQWALFQAHRPDAAERGPKDQPSPAPPKPRQVRPAVLVGSRRFYPQAVALPTPEPTRVDRSADGIATRARLHPPPAQPTGPAVGEWGRRAFRPSLAVRQQRQRDHGQPRAARKESAVHACKTNRWSAAAIPPTLRRWQRKDQVPLPEAAWHPGQVGRRHRASLDASHRESYRSCLKCGERRRGRGIRRHRSNRQSTPVHPAR